MVRIREIVEAYGRDGALFRHGEGEGEGIEAGVKIKLLQRQLHLLRLAVRFVDEGGAAGHIGKNFGYPTGWAEWINEAKAEALPGAVEFLNYVVEKGADVFYVSNRKAKLKEATMKNLKALGFPQVVDMHMLLREDTSDKEPRRQKVRENHRIVLLIGDNLNDLIAFLGRKESMKDWLLWMG